MKREDHPHDFFEAHIRALLGQEGCPICRDLDRDEDDYFPLDSTINREYGR